eukprot:TRINITY_DN32160_c0_g1_i1.p1 TRINITY_DN32160_c0_g1~~TRINITY_DN32160_c0_g1_i1.p1  ORF type:complete len:158 (+),score=86.97 TRINITY_DN32160_c0_g1_i1:58-531(+)
MAGKKVAFAEEAVGAGGFSLNLKKKDDDSKLPVAVQMRNKVKAATAAKKGKRDCVNAPIKIPEARPMTRQEKRRMVKPIKIMSQEERDEMKAKYRDRKKAMKELSKGAGKKRRALRIEREEEARKRTREEVAEEDQEMLIDSEPEEEQQPKKKRRRM